VLADDGARWKWSPVEQARAACEAGAAVVQLRAKHATDRETLAWAAAIRELTRAHGLLFVVNDRVDLALAAEADGVHLGQEDLPPARVPAFVRERLLIGRSTHTEAEVHTACGEPVDYLGFGPIFASASKATPHAARGLTALAKIVKLAAPRPVVAIGGIGAESARRVRAAGAAGVAVISAVAGADDPLAAARALGRSLGNPEDR
jgi:thiamine-phosphate pyrophosphorylase